MIFNRLKLSKTFVLSAVMAAAILSGAILAGAILTGAAGAAMAQGVKPENKGLTGPTGPVEFRPNKVSVSLLRQNDKSGEAFIRLSTKDAISGCPRVKPLRQTMEIENPSLFISVDGYTIDYSSLSRSPQYSCKTSMQYATANIPLDRKLIEDNKLEQIKFSMSKGGGSDIYKIVLNQNSLELLPESDHIFESGKMPTGGRTALLHWYYPANTIVLTAPALPAGQRDQAIEDFARNAGMTAITEVIPAFEAPAGQTHRHYYVDDSGKTIENVPGRDDVAVSDKIYARRPGTYE